MLDEDNPEEIKSVMASISRQRRQARRLAAFMAIDVFGYSRLMSDREEETHARIGDAFHRLSRQISKFDGREFSYAGDSLMAEFPSAVQALKCALRIQAEASRRNIRVSPDRRIELRIGINSGDIVDDDGRLGGDAVNVAARLEQVAEPGTINISAAVFDQTSRIVVAQFECLGAAVLKNIRQPVVIYRTAAATLAQPVLPVDAVLSEYPAVEHRPSLAVLPFRTLQADQADAYYAASMVDDIIHSLGSLRELLVIARGSTHGYTGTSVDLHRVSRELGVRYVLHGSLRRSGERLRIVAELTEAANGSVVWAERFDGSSSELFELQDQISIRVAATIAPRVRERELRRAIRKRPDSMTAYDLVLQALDLFHRMEPLGFERAGELLRQATVHDQGYGPAYSHTAYWHITRVGQGWSTNPQADAAAAAVAAAAAMARDGNDAQALAIYGHMQAYLFKDYRAAIEHLDHAIAAGPNCAMAWSHSSVTRGLLGHTEAAILHAQHGVRLSPLSPDVYWSEYVLCQAHYLAGDHAAAIAWGQRAYARNSVQTSGLRTLTASLVAGGRLRQAQDIGRQLMTVDPGFKLTAFAMQTPMRGAVRDIFVCRLKMAGLPE